MTDDELKRLLDANAEETRKQFASAMEESRRHFDVNAHGLQRTLQLVAEGVVGLTEKHDSLDQKVEQLTERLERGFTETQVMIKFSHSELDRRIRTLEETVAEIQNRLGRLESSTH